MRRDHCAAPFLFPVVLVFGLLLVAPIGNVVAAIIVSTWNSTADVGQWSNTLNWSGGIPIAAGDIASLSGSPSKQISVSLSSPVTLGRLNLSGQPTFRLTGTGPLTFDNPGADSAGLRVIAPLKNHRIEVPLSIASGEELIVDVPTTAVLTFQAGPTAGSGDLHVRGGGALELFGASPSWNGFIRVDSSTVSLSQGTRNNPIEIVSSARLENANSNAAVLNGPISGTGDITYGRSLFSLFGSNTYEGLTTIGAATVEVRSANALGSSLQGTVVNSFGQLNINVAVPEPITLRGGILRIDPNGMSTGTITLESGQLMMPQTSTIPIVLANSGAAAVVAVGNGVTISGGVTGAGDFSLTGSVKFNHNPIAHNGSLFVKGLNTGNVVTLDAANTFTGTIEVTSGQLVVNHPDALGTSTSPVVVKEAAELHLNVAADREFSVSGGLYIDKPGITLNRTIVLSSTSSSGAIRGQGVINGEVQIAPTPTARPGLGGGTFNGIVSGSADRFGLSPFDRIILNAANTYRGVTEIQFNSGSGIVDANNARSLGDPEQGTLVSGAILNMNVTLDEPVVVNNNGRANLNVQQARLPRLFNTDTFIPTHTQAVAINVPSQYDERVDVLEGKLLVNADTMIRSAAVREGGEIAVATGKTPRGCQKTSVRGPIPRIS